MYCKRALNKTFVPARGALDARGAGLLGTASDEDRLKKNVVQTLHFMQTGLAHQLLQAVGGHCVIATCKDLRRAAAIRLFGSEVHAQVVAIAVPFPDLDGKETSSLRITMKPVWAHVG